MRFSLDPIPPANAKYVGMLLPYQGNSYTIVWPGVFTRRRKLRCEHISILQLLGTSGRDTKDFLFCTLFSKRGKVVASKLPRGAGNPFHGTTRRYRELENNIVPVVVVSKSSPVPLPCYPLCCFLPKKARKRAKQLYDMSQHVTQFKGWVEASEDACAKSSGAFLESALCQRVPAVEHALVRVALFD